MDLAFHTFVHVVHPSCWRATITAFIFRLVEATSHSCRLKISYVKILVLGHNCSLLRVCLIKGAIHSHGDGKLIEVAILSHPVDHSG